MGKPSIRLVLLPLLVVVLGFGLGACEDDVDEATDDLGEQVEEATEDLEEQAEQAEEALGEVFEGGDEFDAEENVGRRITISGEAADVIDDTAFRLGSANIIDDEILVINAPRTDLEEGQDARVTGTVRRFDVAEAERETGLDLDDEELADFEDDNVIIATAVTVLPDVEE